MDNNTNWTPGSNENKLGLTNSDEINALEALGLVKAELFVFDLDESVEISTSLILEIHRIAFEELYDWAGKWREVEVMVGKIQPPEAGKVPYQMYQFIENLNQKIKFSETRQEQIETIMFAHYEFVKIHPFNNGNGRTGRLLMDLVCVIFGFEPLNIYSRQGTSRTKYIDSLQEADKGNFNDLKLLIESKMKPL